MAVESFQVGGNGRDQRAESRLVGLGVARGIRRCRAAQFAAVGDAEAVMAAPRLEAGEGAPLQNGNRMVVGAIGLHVLDTSAHKGTCQPPVPTTAAAAAAIRVITSAGPVSRPFRTPTSQPPRRSRRAKKGGGALHGGTRVVACAQGNGGHHDQVLRPITPPAITSSELSLLL
jgi:hypothetical protein